MAVISSGKGSRSAAGSIRYVQFEKHSTNSRVTYTEGLECSPYYQDAIQDFKDVRDSFGKTGGRQAHHMVLAFSPKEEERFSKEELFQKAIDIAENTFPNHQVWLGMHDDTEHLHVHMIVNSINLESGNKLQIAGRKGMQAIMEKVQLRGREIGLDSELEVGKRKGRHGDVATHNIVERKLIEQGQSWKAEIARIAYEALQKAKSRKEFIKRCLDEGVVCTWEETRKHVTFAVEAEPDKKVRNGNLAKTFTMNEFSSKEKLEKVLSHNRTRGNDLGRGR